MADALCVIGFAAKVVARCDVGDLVDVARAAVGDVSLDLGESTSTEGETAVGFAASSQRDAEQRTCLYSLKVLRAVGLLKCFERGL